MIRVVPDCSLLSHAIIPKQQTASAVAALFSASPSEVEFVAPSAVLTEFLSLLRKLITRGNMNTGVAGEIFERVESLLSDRAEPSDAALARAWSIATRLGQSDVFDAL